ncbi:MAG: TfoX/Sxy family protein [Pirellulales bacterium]|jgi:TfoX/Sxy family transcriptional regulator of competence genes
MVYDEHLNDRVSRVLLNRKGIVPKKMFGGIGYMLYGNLCVGVGKDSLIARVGLDNYEDALEQPFVSEFSPTGKPMRGWVLISLEALEDEDELQSWIRVAYRFAKSLPPK